MLEHFALHPTMQHTIQEPVLYNRTRAGQRNSKEFGSRPLPALLGGACSPAHPLRRLSFLHETAPGGNVYYCTLTRLDTSNTVDLFE